MSSISIAVARQASVSVPLRLNMASPSFGDDGEAAASRLPRRSRNCGGCANPAGAYHSRMPGTGTAGVVAYEAIHRLATSGLTQLELLEEVARRVRAVVPYDSGAWMTVDPATLLHTGVFVEGAHRDSGAVHLRYADNEYLAPDFLKLVDVARLRTPVLTLREATGGDQALSRRHRTIHADLGVGEELRAVFRSGAT